MSLSQGLSDHSVIDKVWNLPSNTFLVNKTLKHQAQHVLLELVKFSTMYFMR